MSAPTRADLAEHRSRCKSCQARVIWTWTEHGKRMQVDDGPAPNGNVWLETSGGRIVSAVLGNGDARRRRALGQTLYLAHFATCPNANQHRRRR